MAIQRTFSIIKPDATKRNLTGAVNAVIEKAGLRIVAQKRILMTRAQAETFYSVVINVVIVGFTEGCVRSGWKSDGTFVAVPVLWLSR